MASFIPSPATTAALAEVRAAEAHLRKLADTSRINALEVEIDALASRLARSDGDEAQKLGEQLSGIREQLAAAPRATERVVEDARRAHRAAVARHRRSAQGDYQDHVAKRWELIGKHLGDAATALAGIRDTHAEVVTTTGTIFADDTLTAAQKLLRGFAELLGLDADALTTTAAERKRTAAARAKAQALASKAAARDAVPDRRDARVLDRQLGQDIGRAQQSLGDARERLRELLRQRRALGGGFDMEQAVAQAKGDVAAAEEQVERLTRARTDLEQRAAGKVA